MPDLPIRATWSATAAIRRTPSGRAARASPCSSSSTTRKAARARCCTAIPLRSTSSPRSSARQAYPARHLSMESIYEYGSRAGVWRLLREFERRACRSRCSASPWRSSATRRRPRRSSSRATKSPATGGAGSTIRTSTRPPSASTCALGVEIVRRLTGARAGRLVHRPRQPQHAAAGRRARRLSLRFRPLRRRSAVLDQGHDREGGTHRTSSSPTRSTPTTCASPRRRASIPATSSSPTCATRSTSSMPKARSGRRCSRSACIAGCWDGPAASPGCALPRPRRAARARLDLPARRHRAALDRAPSLPSPGSAA